MTHRILQNGWLALCIFMPFFLLAQISFNANTQAPPTYTGTFRIGMNMGTGYPAFPTDESLSTLAYTANSKLNDAQARQADADAAKGKKP